MHFPGGGGSRKELALEALGHHAAPPRDALHQPLQVTLAEGCSCFHPCQQRHHIPGGFPALYSDVCTI